METVTRLCFCAERIHAMGTGDFRYSHTFGGWWFPDAPCRSVSKRTRYFASERGDPITEDHTDEPYIHTECPWCQNTLPGARLEDEQRPRPTTQSDGDSSCD